MNTSQKIAVVGATGRVGSHVVKVLGNVGHEVVPISRSHGVDLVTGAGLAAALSGVDTIVDAASGATPDRDEATRFFVTGAHHLLEAGERAGVRKIVSVSIIGCDRFSGEGTSGGGFGGYYAAKTAQERALLDGPIPVQILRAAQFHEFVEQLLAWGTRGDVAYVPAMRTQLVAARSVAEALAGLAMAPGTDMPATGIPEIAGPRPERLVEQVRLLAARRGGPATVEEVSDPGDPDGHLLAGDGLLPGPHATLAGPTFEQWVASPTG